MHAHVQLACTCKHCPLDNNTGAALDHYGHRRVRSLLQATTFPDVFANAPMTLQCSSLPTSFTANYLKQLAQSFSAGQLQRGAPCVHHVHHDNNDDTCLATNA